MAIIDNTNSGNQQQQQNAGQQQQQANHAQHDNRRPTGNGWNFQTIESAPIAQAGDGAAYLNTFLRSMETACKANAPKEIYDIGFIPVSRGQYPNLVFGAVVVTFANKKDPDLRDKVSYHTLILEGTGQKLSKINVPGSGPNQQPYQKNRVTSDAMNSIMRDIVKSAVAAKFPNAELIPASAMVVPGNIDATTRENEVNDSICAILYKSIIACSSDLKTSVGQGMFNLAHFTGAVMENTTTYGNHVVSDIFNNPIRANVLIQLNNVTNTNGNSRFQQPDLNGQQNEVKVMQISGFIQPVWGRNSNENAHFRVQTTQQVQPFVSELVITDLDLYQASSPSMLALALVNIILGTSGDSYYQAYIPRGRNGEAKSTSNIGALNIVGNITNFADNNGFGFEVSAQELEDLSVLRDYLMALLQDGIALSIDCPEFGPQTSYLRLFYNAAMGDVQAKTVLLDSLNETLDGKFLTCLPEGSPLFTGAYRVPVGTYIRDDNTKGDLREVDTIFIANKFANDPGKIRDFMNTMVPVGANGTITDAQLAERELLISLATRDTAQIDRYVQRITFHPNLIKAVMTAFAMLQVPLRVNSPSFGAMRYSGVQAAQHIMSSVMRNDWTPSYAPVNNSGSYGRTFHM